MRSFIQPFQGEPTLHGEFRAEELRFIAREAFPAHPMTSLYSQQVGYRLIGTGDGVVASRIAAGGRDKMNRPVLEARAVWLDAADLAPDRATRDLFAVLEALSGPVEPSALEASIRANSAFAGASDALAGLQRHPEVWAALAEGMAQPLDVHNVAGLEPPLRLPLLLLSRTEIGGLSLALGGMDRPGRERVLVTPTSPPQPPSGGGLLDVFKRSPPPQTAWATLTPSVSSGLIARPCRLAVVEALVDVAWPRLSEAARLMVVLAVLDSRDAPGPTQTPYALVPELEELRRALARIDAFSKAMS